MIYFGGKMGFKKKCTFNGTDFSILVIKPLAKSLPDVRMYDGVKLFGIVRSLANIRGKEFFIQRTTLGSDLTSQQFGQLGMDFCIFKHFLARLEVSVENGNV